MWLNQNGKSSDLGLGHDVRFAKDGSIQGFLVCDTAGKPVEEVSGKSLYGKLLELRFRWFSFKNGKRKDDKVLRTVVPFKDKNYSDWLDPDPGIG